MKQISVSQRFFVGFLLSVLLLGASSHMPAQAQDQGASASAPLSSEEKAQLEFQLSDLEKQIKDHEDTIAQYRKQGTSLKGEIAKLNAQVDKLNLQIKAVTLSLSRLNSEIHDNQQQVTVTQQKIDLNKGAVMAALQSTYESERVSLMTILLQNPNLSDFFSDVNNLMAVQDTLTDRIQQINALKDNLLDQQEDLVAKKAQTAALKALQDKQKKNVVATTQEKSTLLTQTKGQEAAYQTLLKQKQAEAAKIRSRLFELLGGGEMTFETAYELAKNAQRATGVPAALLLAVLDRESALGKNVGKCSYKTAMAPGPPKSKRDDITPFLQITSELGIDPEKQLVSCAIVSDGAYGGAMGPAQFIPTTWMLYKDRIAAATGSNPPSPWKNSDAFVATALYLKDAMSACTGAYSSGDAQIKCAAARYYAGGSWSKFISSYGSATLNRMNKFEDDIAAISA